MWQAEPAFFMKERLHLNKINIAIDGPAGAGKSTVARKVAGLLGYIYVDTGAMYRAVTWEMLRSGIDPEDSSKVIPAAKGLDIRLLPGASSQVVLVNGEDVTEHLRSNEVSNKVSYVARIAEVRTLLVDIQQAMASSRGVVMDGRDIGTKVLPDAELKVFLTASVRRRAERRYLELQERAESVTLEQLADEIAERDKLDSERVTSPLEQAPDAILIDSTDMSIDQVVDRIVELSLERRGEVR
jgi:CMP/dCMP kinase